MKAVLSVSLSGHIEVDLPNDFDIDNASDEDLLSFVNWDSWDWHDETELTDVYVRELE